MYPVTVASFVAVKIFDPAGQSFIYKFYFITWLLLTLFFILKKDNYFTNKYALLSGNILGLLIPIVNGFSTGNWIWETYLNQRYSIFIVDVFWIIIASTALFAVAKMKKPVVQTALPGSQTFEREMNLEFKR